MYLRKSTNDEAKQVRSLEQQQQIVTAKEATLTQAGSELERVSRALPTEQQFVELTRSYLKTLLKTKDLVEEDLVYREVVLNLRAGNDCVSVIKLNPPCNLMVDLEKVPSGRDEHLLLELFNYITEKPLVFEHTYRDIQREYSKINRGEAMTVVL